MAKLSELTTKEKKELLLVCLEENMGIVAQACQQADLSRTIFYRYMKDKKFSDAVRNITETTKDFVESKLLKNIEAGDTTAIIFYLKCRAKDRGYVEKIEVENSGSLDINLKSYKEMSLEELIKEEAKLAQLEEKNTRYIDTNEQ